jgi:hypothetical protein
VIPAFDPNTGALPPGDHRATLEEVGSRFGFTPRRRWLLGSYGLARSAQTAVETSAGAKGAVARHPGRERHVGQPDGFGQPTVRHQWAAGPKP